MAIEQFPSCFCSFCNFDVTSPHLYSVLFFYFCDFLDISSMENKTMSKIDELSYLRLKIVKENYAMSISKDIA